jgi:aminopeptidase N
MRTDQGVTIHRADYRAPAYAIDAVELSVDLDPKVTTVRSRLVVRRAAGVGPAEPLQLDGEALELIEVAIDGHLLGPEAFTYANDQLVIAGVPEQFVLDITTRCSPEANTALSGLYVSNENFYTQCEAQGFRRITFFADRPDVMARYRVTLRAERARWPVLLSNGNLIAQGDCDGAHAESGPVRAGWHWCTWEDPFPKPSYLFALVAGRLVVTESTFMRRSGRPALLQVWVEPGNEHKTEHAMRSLERSIRWDESRYGLELDLDRFMIVATGDFNMGAMENKGLNIFNTRYVFAHPRLATDQDFAAVESVVAHEYFHNWTGNRVTCRDWFQLTLKEGLTVFRDQEFSADMMAAQCESPSAAASARAVKRINDVRVLRTSQFPEDAGPMAHPIRPDAYQEINNFYTLTVYEKGAEVIRMLQTLAGREGFRKGVDMYFARHDGQAVTCDDFVAAIADANQLDLTQFSRWYAQAGTPRVAVSVSVDEAARVCELIVTQHTPATPGQPVKLPLPIPFAIGLLSADGAELPIIPADESTRSLIRSVEAGTALVELREASHRLRFAGIGRRPVLSLARGFSAPVIIEHDWSNAELDLLAAHDSDPFNRWEAAQQRMLRAVRAVMNGADPAVAGASVAALIGRLLDDQSLDPAFVDALITFPSETFIAEQIDQVDPQALRAARLAVRAVAARELEGRWSALYRELNDDKPWTVDLASAGRRALKNAALGWWVEAGAGAAAEAAAAQCANADNMTDRSAALAALVRVGGARRDQSLAAFEREFADEPLVLDKWFSMQATAVRCPGEPPVLEQVKRLMNHPAFSLRNPNKVRSLITAFCTGNLAEFHQTDGTGYAFWADQVIALDALNPQLAARLARALDRWPRYGPERASGMREALSRVARHPGLSPDVAEIVGKALAVGSAPGA